MLLHFETFAWVERLMLVMKDISQLIRHTLSIADFDIHIVVRMTIYPVINAAILDIVFQFHCKGSVGLAIGKLGALHLEGWYMVSYNNLLASFAV